MAQINKNALLCICIPIYNRLNYLDRMLSRFLEDKDLFDDTINLIVSDNCSQEDLQSCCKFYQDQGLNLLYHRNEENLGSNGNFLWCFENAVGKYIWLLGSDDIPKSGNLQRLVNYLECKDYGLFHISIVSKRQGITEYSDAEEMAVAVNYWITFMSSNIISTSSLQNIRLAPYKETWLVQVPAYLNACCMSNINAVLGFKEFFESESDALNNGGYNLFKVFVTNLYGIYEEFIDKSLLSRKVFNRIIKIEYKEFLVYYIIQLLIHRKECNFQLEGSWNALRKYYGRKPYAYYYLIKRLFRNLIQFSLRVIKHH